MTAGGPRPGAARSETGSIRRPRKGGHACIRHLQGLLTIIIGVGGCIGYFYLSNQFLDKVLLPPSGPNAGRNINRANLIRPWLFLAPAVFALGLYLAYPVVETLRLSLTERIPGGGSKFVGVDNYAQMFGEPKFWEAMKNNMLWLIVVPAAGRPCSACWWRS